MGGMMMRKTVSLLLTIIVFSGLIQSAYADTEVKAYCMISADSCEMLSGQSTDEQYGAAGLCKLPAILTLCRSMDRGLIERDAVVSVSKSASGIGGPTAFLKHGEQITAEELFRAAVMISAGDAIYALMEHAFGSEDVFLQNIQLTLKEIGVDHEMRKAPGNSEQFTCRDLALLGDAALKSETFRAYCTEKYAILHHADGRDTELANANKLLNTLSGCIGLITGSSNEDGYCGVFACRRKDTTFILALVGAKNSKSRFELATRLYEEAFSEFSVTPLCDIDEALIEEYPVEGGDVDRIDLYTKESISVLRKKSDGDPASEFRLPDVLHAPLDPESAVGTVLFTDANGNVLYELALYPKERVEATGFRESMKRVIKSYCNG